MRPSGSVLRVGVLVGLIAGMLASAVIAGPPGVVAAPPSVVNSGAEDAGVVPKNGGVCLDCPAFDFTIAPRPFVADYHEAYLAPNDCNWYQFEVDERYEYEFSLCDEHSGGFSEFPSWIGVFDASCTELLSADASGGLGCADFLGVAFIMNVFPGGTHFLEIRSMNGEPGNYRLAYWRTCPARSQCTQPDAEIVPTVQCRLTSGVLDWCHGVAYYGVDLVAGCTYHFSACPASCPGAGAEFDAILRLYDEQGAAVIPNAIACDNGEIELTVPPWMSGRFCVEVAREAPGGIGDEFHLAYWVTCEPPESLVVGPDVGVTTAPDCSREEEFSAIVAGVGPFDWEWSITPPAGGSATPSSGTATTPGNELTWDSVVEGAGDYGVSVSAANMGGAIEVTTTYALLDQGPPELTISAEPAACAVRPVRLRSAAPPARASHPPGRATMPSRDELESLILRSADPHEVGLELASRLGLPASDVRVEDRRDMALSSSTGSGLGCAAPCSGNDVLAVASPFDELTIACDTGEVSARAEGSRLMLVAPESADAERVISACVFYPRDSASERNGRGIEAEWTSAEDGARMRQEIVAFGTTAADAGLRLTTIAQRADGILRSVSLILPARIKALACVPVAIDACRGECVRLEAEASDNCGPATLTHLGGSPGAPPCVGNPCLIAFPDEGEFEYAWEATDAAGNSVECSAIVTVEGCNEAPSCSAGAPAAPTCRAIPIAGASVSDPDGDAIAWSWTSDNFDVTIDPPSGTIPAGMGARVMPPVTARLAPQASACAARATLTLRVDDGQGGVSSCAIAVAFTDGEAPVIVQGGAYSACLWPPNHWYACFSPEELGLVVRDACSEPVTWSIASCSSDQPDGGRDRRWNGDGRTADDCVVESDGHSFCVRSERAGTGPDAQDGRHYSIAIVVTDACGNVSNELPLATIHVPHDRSPRDPGCIDVTREGCRSLPCSP